MSSLIIRNGVIFNRGKCFESDIYIVNDRIEKIAPAIDIQADREIDAFGKWVIPGIIDDQVHFREPGLTHKADIESESRAAVAGGVTSFMEMPNTKPPTLTQELLEQKYQIAAQHSWANYSFFMGASNDNIEEVLKTDATKVCGIKVFMGSSTGNMLVDDEKALEQLFSKVDMLIATHCEDEKTIRENLEIYTKKSLEKLTAESHPLIRSIEACLLSSSKAVALAKKHNTRLHVLHISTKDELALFTNKIPLKEKRITAEACVHHLYFTSKDYLHLGNQIKCNPAIKEPEHAAALFPALLDDTLDIIATDHAPHTWQEKSLPYMEAPSGLPLVHHSLNMMLDFLWKGAISMEKIVEKMCHAPADCFRLVDRGYLDEGKFADLVIIDPTRSWMVNKANILYKCAWSPLEGMRMKGKVTVTVINGKVIYKDGVFDHQGCGQRLLFEG
ncbi:MAG TPA: dihydroorotase [Saprospiraceae bacterium]|nr:dihydroorotase [Saprospiraceae bacterium]HPN71047.1 dihydroorotase [Saprospiraceae bacterium]